MPAGRLVVVALVVCGFACPAALAQTSQRGQATSPGQSRAVNRLPQAPSGGVPTGSPAAGPQTDQQKQADDQAKRSTQICKGC